MAQVGLHALTSLVIGDSLLHASVRSKRARQSLLFGYVVGNILPDMDYLAVVGLFPVNQELAFTLHRGFSHSLLAALSVAIGFYLASVLMADLAIRYTGYGVALGIATHFTLDLFLWFSPVDIFWPASALGWIPPLDLWFWYQPPALVGRLLGCAEFAAYALYFDHLAKLALIFHTNPESVGPAERMATVSWILWALLTALALELPAGSYDLFVYLLVGTVFLPACLYLTWQMQDTIERLGDSAGQWF